MASVVPKKLDLKLSQIVKDEETDKEDKNFSFCDFIMYLSTIPIQDSPIYAILIFFIVGVTIISLHCQSGWQITFY